MSVPRAKNSATFVVLDGDKIDSPMRYSRECGYGMRSPVFRDKNDILLRGFALDGHARVVVVDTSRSLKLCERSMTQVLSGRLHWRARATATLMLSATLKERQQVGIQINGDGPLGELYAIADHTGRVRATVSNPRAVVPFKSSDDIPLSKGIGIGRLTVIRRLSEAPPYRGVVPLVDGGIAADLAEYFVSSEQTPTAVFIGEYLSGNGIQAAGGLFVQALPGCDEAALEKVIGEWKVCRLLVNYSKKALDRVIWSIASSITLSH